MRDCEVHLIRLPDTGYTKVCGACANRWGDDPRMVGKDRSLDHQFCPSCIAKRRDKAVARASVYNSTKYYDRDEHEPRRRKRKRTRNGKIVKSDE